MGGFTPLTRAAFRSILVNQLQASLAAANVPVQAMPDTGPDSVLGAAFDALAAEAEYIQFQAAQYHSLSRLATTPANDDGSVSADAASFTAPFGVTPASGSFASSTAFSLNLKNAASVPVPVPIGLLIVRSDGEPFQLIADPAQPANLGTAVYTIPAGQLSVAATFVCLDEGPVGNVLDPTTVTYSISSGPGDVQAPALASVTNASAITSGVAGESQAAFAARFTLRMENGPFATQSAIVAAALGVQAGLIVSYGAHVNQDGSYHQSFFTLVVNVAGSPTSPPSSLLAEITTALGPVVSDVAEFVVVAPTLVTPVIAGNIAVRAGYSKPVVEAQVAAAVQALVNGIGLNQSGGPTTLSYASTLAAMVNQQAFPGVNPVGTTLTFNGGTADVTAPFGSQIVCPAAPTFTTS